MPGSGASTSFWLQQRELEQTGTLRENINADVCVIGAGIAGLTTAYLLGKAGKRVAVIDAREIASGETLRTTAHLSNAIDRRYYEIERLRGSSAARLVAESHSAAIERIGAIAAEEGIDCGYTRLDGYLFPAPEQSLEILDKELAAAQRAGLPVMLVDRAPLGDFDTGRCLRFPDQGQIDPGAYIAGLRQAVQQQGGHIYTRTSAHELRPGHVVTYQGFAVNAGSIVVATNSPISNKVTVHTKLYPYRTYAIAGTVPRGSVARCLCWDTLDSYHYIRLASPSEQQDHDVLIVGGEDHKVGHADDAQQRYDRLEAWTRQRFPMLGELQARWSGQVQETLDGLGYIGRSPMASDSTYIATGDCGMGMTHGTIAGMLLSDLILGQANPWTELYEPSRKPLSTAREYLTENLDVAQSYLDWFTGATARSPEEIRPGTGALLRRGASLIAAYRDDQGQLHELSAKCTHLQCVVHWNSGEQSWDCPCHGSRFATDGSVLQPPALHALHPANKDAKDK